jgi:hypothetical protein
MHLPDYVQRLKKILECANIHPCGPPLPRKRINYNFLCEIVDGNTYFIWFSDKP